MKCLARGDVIEMTLESVDDTIFSLPDILYTTLRASNEVYEVRVCMRWGGGVYLAAPLTNSNYTHFAF